jgi:hypothetical protein
MSVANSNEDDSATPSVVYWSKNQLLAQSITRHNERQAATGQGWGEIFQLVGLCDVPGQGWEESTGTLQTL